MQPRIYLSGRVGFEVAGELAITEREFRGRQERVAFAYLVLERARPFARDELADVLWPDDRPAAWQTGLSAVVSRLRSLLAREPVAGLPASMSRGFGQYRLFLPAGVWVDVEAAANAVDAAEAALRENEPPAAFGPATVAATIARRPFLSGDGGGWVAREREVLERVRVRALDCLARVWLAAGEPQYAVEAAAEAVGADPLREASYRLLMQAHAAAGNRAGAMRSYHDCASAWSMSSEATPRKRPRRCTLRCLGKAGTRNWAPTADGRRRGTVCALAVLLSGPAKRRYRAPSAVQLRRDAVLRRDLVERGARGPALEQR